jgi:hypothetical protein
MFEGAGGTVEQARASSRPPSTLVQVDIWALGVIVHWMLSGLMPWEPHLFNQARAHRAGHYFPPREANVPWLVAFYWQHTHACSYR